MTDSPRHPVRVLCVCGARPNFIKIGPLMAELRRRPRFAPSLVHTGQHYDAKLSKVFFEELGIPRPDVTLDVGSGSHAVQTAEVMRRFEGVLDDTQPEVVVVVGDVNSTLACALVAAKYHLATSFEWKGCLRRRPVIVHVEAGLRSLDDDMPEEVNRRLTDVLSDVLLVSDPAGLGHLAREGAAPDRVHFVGNVMIDTLLSARAAAMKSPVLTTLGLEESGYVLLTLHRPSNVDDPVRLEEMLRLVESLAPDRRCVFPVHPRTRACLEGISLDPTRWVLTEPLGYLDFLRLQAGAWVVLTDSGGVQEETTVLGVPCVTLRENTERPITIEEGTNSLGGLEPEGVRAAYTASLAKRGAGRRPRLWDGSAAVRIVDVLEGLLFPAGGD